jgi:nucleoside-diphosphate-sugar epimerase
MGKIFATGKTGTIGKNFESSIFELKVDLANFENSMNLISVDERDIIIHAAGIVGNTLIERDPEYAYKVNVIGTRKLAQFALGNKISKFVFISSSHVYANSTSKINEQYSTQPNTIYALQKLESELELLKLFREDLSRLCIIRVFSVLDWDVKDFTLGGGIKKLINNDSDFILENALDIRDFLTPKQIADAIIKISTKPSISGIINLCSGIGTSIENAAVIMSNCVNMEIPEHKIKRVNSEVPYLVGDNSKLVTHLPRLDLVWKPSRFIN